MIAVRKEVMIGVDVISMKSSFCALLMTVLLVTARSLCVNNCTILIDPLTECNNAKCNNNSSCDFLYNDFTDALINLDAVCENSVTINLTEREYFIEQYGITISKNISIYGQGNTFINCKDLYADQSVTSLLLFNNQATVELHGLTFISCPRPIRFHNIRKLAISYCNFNKFSNGAVDVLNAQSFVMSECKFENDSTSHGDGSIRADSGGLALRYTQNGTNDFIAILQSCYFIRGMSGKHMDTKTVLSRFLASGINSGLNENRFIGRGGGMGIYISVFNSSVTVIVRNCLFINNYAILFGGGLYLYAGGGNSNHTILVEDTTFVNNSVAAAGGAIQMALLIQNVGFPGSQFSYTNCTFQSNSADYGGAMSAIQTYVRGRGNIVNVKECEFVENSSTDKGSAIIFASLLYPENVEPPHIYRIIDCNFVNNTDPGGIVNLGFNNAEFYGLNKFENNTGPSLRVVGSLIKIFGTLVFKNNDALSTTGASLYISEFGQLQVSEGTFIEFNSNKGEISAGIYVDIEVYPASYVTFGLQSNTQCFIIHSNQTLAPAEWKNVSIKFSDNVAKLGVTVFTTSLDLCLGQNNYSNAIVHSSSFKYEQNTNTKVSDSATNITDRNYYIQTSADKVLFNGSKQKIVSARPGQSFKLYIEPLDEFNHTTFAIVRFTDIKDKANPQSFNPSSVTGSDVKRNPNAIDLVHTDPTLSPFLPSDGYISLTFGLPNFPTRFVEPSIIQDTQVLIEMPFNTKNVEIARFDLKVLPCRAGFALKNHSNGLVQCDCIYPRFYFGNQLVSCNRDTEELIVIDGFWSTSVKRDRYHLENYPCPVPYCMCLKSETEDSCPNYFNHTDPNAQCHPSRNGILCGACVNNTGVGVLSLTCLENCHSYVGIISIVLLVVWNGILAVLLLCLSYKFPPDFKGILFYIQIVPYLTEYFPISVWKHKQYMLYISSFLSFYFPADFCLFPDVDALAVYAVGYIPLVVIILTQLIVVRIIVSFNRTRRSLRKSAVFNGLWTWILLVYSRYIYSALNILNCPTIGNEGARWFRDGTVQCFQSPSHAFLALLAIAVLAVGLALIPLIILLVYKKIKFRVAMYMYEPLTHGYKQSLKWWAAFDLLRRYVLILVIVVLPGKTLLHTGFLFLAFLMHIYFQPYQLERYNWLEGYILLHFIAMMLLRSTAGLLDQLSSYDGTMVPITENQLNSSRSIAAWPKSDKATIFFLIWIYFPVIFGMLYCPTAYAISKIKERFQNWSMTRSKNMESINAEVSTLQNYVELKDQSSSKQAEKVITVSYA